MEIRISKMISGWIAVLLCLLAWLYSSNGSTVNRGYIFTAPKHLLAGEAETVCVSLHNVELPAHVLVELFTLENGSDEEILATTNEVLRTGMEACMELIVPMTKHSIATLRVKMKFNKHPDYLVNAQKEVFIDHDSVVSFVETDKSVYKPGQTVNIRILMLKHDLKPHRKAIPKVWIENPSEIRVAQWTNVSTEHGMAQLTFGLSAEPSPGTWKIKVEKNKAYPHLGHTATFEVKKYILPRFQVTIKSPGYILADTEIVTWNICAKYSYGKPVKGTLILKLTPQTASWRRKHNHPEIKYGTIDSPDGCTEFRASGEELGHADWTVAPNNIILTANFTETGTGLTETASSKTVVVHQALKLEFIPYTSKYFKLGLPYHGKLRVLFQDDTPTPNEKIQLCLRVRGKEDWISVVVECRNFTTSIDGFLDFIVPPQHKNIVLLHFAATAVNYATKYYSPDKRWRVFMDQPSAYIEVTPWYSPSDSYLAVARGSQPIICGEKYSFNVMYTIPSNHDANISIPFHYSINSKGDLLIFGHVKHKPHKNSALNYSEFHNLLGAVESSANKTDQSYIVHRFPLSVKVTPSMAPISELLLYYVRPDGETVATTYTIEVGNCFENKVKTAWHDDVQNPGASTQFHIEAAPWSLCGISAVDKSTRFLAGHASNLINTDQTFNKLKKFDVNNVPALRSWAHCEGPIEPETSAEEIDHLPRPAVEEPPEWDLRKKRHALNILGQINYVDAMQAFNDFGVIVMTDLTLETRPCPELSYFRRLFSQHVIKMHRSSTLQDKMMIKPLAFPLLNFQDQTMSNTGMAYVDQQPDQATTLRSYFPETWLWELIPTGKEGKVTIERTLPHTITDWIGHTVCISPKHGLGIAPPATITAFQSFFLDYSLPYSVKRGEILRLKVSLFNYMQHSLPVKIKFGNAEGLDLYISSPTASYCVEPRASIVHEYMLKPRLLGEINITVSAAIDPDYAKPCGPEILIHTKDTIIKPIMVQPEGFVVQVTKSAFVCPKDFSDDSTIAWNLELPSELVPDSARAYVSLIGDILGPAFENLENLVRLPMGCGEQNMILFVPNIHVIRYLEATQMQNPILRAKAIKNMEKGYQRELNYRHPDGSYSAFGAANTESGGSIWLTAFVVKSFAQAQSFIHIDERDLKLSVKWIVRRQLENGCFPVIGRVFHKSMKGGLKDSSSSLTAYILISLLESGVPLSSLLINNALNCLEKGIAHNNDDLYTATLSTYALTLLEDPRAQASLQSLMARATRQQDLLWWENKEKPSTGLSIEMTAYAILSLVKIGGNENMIEALKAVRWISKQRNAEGGFTSTQDTVLGLEALTKYAIAMSTKSTDLSVLVTGNEVDHVFRMQNADRLVRRQIFLPVLPTVVEVFAEGEGCVLVQSNLKYNIPHATGSDAFDLSVSAESIASVDECSMQRITACARYKMADEESNMALLEIGMISGYVPDRTSLLSLIEEPSTQVKRFEEERDVISIYFDKLMGQRTCISFIVSRENIVDRPEPANVKLYDYYQLELFVTTSYSFSQACSSAGEDDIQPIPNPMPVEPKFNHSNLEANIFASEDSKTTERLIKNVGKDSANSKHKLGISSTNKPEIIVIPTNQSVEPDDKVLDIVEDVLSSGLEPKMMNVPFIKSSNSFIHPDGLENGEISRHTNRNSIKTEAPEILHESGSGEVPNETNIRLNPLFVEVDHDLEMPEGIEGPSGVFVKPSDDFIKEQNSKSEVLINEEILLPLENSKKIIDYSPSPKKFENSEEGMIVEPEHFIFDRNLYTTPVPEGKPSCPICADTLPADIQNVYCNAKSIVKVAIRRWRKARLLLDLMAPVHPKRLRSTIELNVDPDCSCPPLDKPGSFGLLISFENGNLATLRNHAEQRIDKLISIYALPNTQGPPPEIMATRLTCRHPSNNSTSVSAFRQTDTRELKMTAA
ncbi:alpha-2-macroglobulin-like protein 1 isoform X2 [Cephus cinctus]|uniref:TEP1-F n=1 Tax=Cephus cinctus TaxID=211228 RepID=A0AAJ7C374_CEPCN|nr:alpha-2-macroglobulin-like protein 1 isoform X2 [Cephus cinctus]